MASDRSRPFDRPRFGYTAAVAQQGRVTLDRDVNAQTILSADCTAADALAFVGPCGTQDDGYRISTLRMAAGHASPPASAESAVEYFNFRVAPGTMYLGGQRVTLPAACTYRAQPEWPAPATYDRVQHELVWLDVVETEVGAAEDADLVDVALGGPDTTARLKLLQRIRRSAVRATADCGGAWAEQLEQWARQGLHFDPATMALTPTARLRIGFTEPVSANNPCDPVTSGGYLGPENQLLHLRVTMIGGTPYLAWSYDNASALYQVRSCDDGKTIVLANDPPDIFQYPAKGQWVELLAAAAVHGTADATVPGTLHYTAEPTGTMHRLAQPYGQTASDDATNRMVLDKADPLLTGFKGDPAAPIFVRVWQNAQKIDGNTSAKIELVDIAGVRTGIVANLDWHADLAEGASWEVAVRPSTPQGVYPVEYLQAPQPAIGPRRWACPLAVINWTTPWDAAISDCRNQFDNLVELTRRRAGCCSFTIEVADVHGGAKLQAAIDRARDIARALGGDAGGAFTICLGPGDFELHAPLRLDASHSGLVLEAAAGRTVLGAAVTADAAAFADGLVVLTSAQGVTLRGLELRPVEAPVSAALLRAIRDLLHGGGLNANVLGAPRTAFGVRVADCAGLTVDHCTIAFSAKRPDDGADLIGGGLFLQGANGDLKVSYCRLLSEVEPTFTPLRLDEGATNPIFTHAMQGLEAATLGDRKTFLDKLGLDAARFTTAPASKTGAKAATAKEATTKKIAATERSRETKATRAKAAQVEAAATEISSKEVAPLTPADLVEQKSAAGLAAIVARRMSDAAASPVIALAGLLATDAGSNAFDMAQHPCTLGDAEITDNVATAMGFGTLIIATFDSLRLQDNRCVDGVAGLWVNLSGAVTPPPPENGVRFYPSCQDFEEFQYLQALTSVIAPPRDTSPQHAVMMIFIRKAPTQPQNALFISGNDIRLLWSSTSLRLGRASSQTVTAHSAAGLVLALCRHNDWAAFDADAIPASAAVTGNRVWSGSGFAAPAALVTLSAGAPLAMTGNIFTNAVTDKMRANERLKQPTALSIEVAIIAERGERGVAVAGNALQGSSNLAQLPRPHPAPLENWSSLNADPA